MNVWDDEWGEQEEDWSGGGPLKKPLTPHGSEELLIVLRGHPTLRTPEGERQLDEGEAVHFTTGPAGAHGLRNDTEAPVRYVMAGVRVSPEIAEYPDLKQVTGRSKHGIFFIHDLEEEE